MSRLHGVEGANSYRTKKQELWQLLAGASQQRPQAEDLISPAQGTDNYTPEAKGLADTVRPNIKPQRKETLVEMEPIN
jgi:hypothetical protein